MRPIIAILAEQARAESDNTSWRVGQWHLHNRRHGVWNQQRPFGYVVAEHGRLKPHPTEAPIVRRMKDDFLDGASLRGIARWLNDEGIKPPGVVHAEDARAAGRRAKGPRGDSWYATTVRKVLSQPSIAALVSNKRKLLYDEHGEPISAGEGIATMAERARILAEMERRSVVAQKGAVERDGKRTGAGRPAQHLLVGFVRCSEANSQVGRDCYLRAPHAAAQGTARRCGSGARQTPAAPGTRRGHTVGWGAERRDLAEAAGCPPALPARTRGPPRAGLQHGYAVGRPGGRRMAWREAAGANSVIHRSVCSNVPYLPGDDGPRRQQDSERVLLVQATELPPVTQRRPVKLCGHCQPELPQEILTTLRLVEWSS